MRELSRLLGLVVVMSALMACGVVTRDGSAAGPEQSVPPPATPEQKATASPANPDSATLADFNARLENYLKFKRSVANDSPKLKETSNPAEITAAQEVLAAKIRNVRKDAKQGDIFTPEVTALFKRLMYPELKGSEGRETKQALAEEDGEVAQVQLKINGTWPASEPLTTVPANLLANMPQLPMDVEYRISNKRHLVLRDVDANIIVDFVYNAIR
jgi:hypothetical protein